MSTKATIPMGLALTAALFLGGCGKQVQRVEMPVSPDPSPVAATPSNQPAATTSKVTSKALATPKPSPRIATTPAPSLKPQGPAVPRLAPRGIYYVVKYFSVMTESGIHGFPRGAQVTLLKESSGNFLVTDGIQQASAPRSSFTNDLNFVDALTKPAAPKAAPKKPAAVSSPTAIAKALPPPATADPRAKIAELQRRRELLAQAQRENLEKVHAKRKKDLKDELAVLEEDIKGAEKEIAANRGGQRPVRLIYSPGGTLLSYQGRSAFTLSANGSALPRLILRRDQLRKELRALE